MEAIVAFGNNFGIGKNGTLPWRVPRDMQHFRQLTHGHTLVMGRKTFESLPGPLKNRKIIVVTSSARSDDTANNIVFRTIEEVQDEISPADKVFIAGGEQIYRYFLPYVDILHVTKIHENINSFDAFFPSELLEEFVITSVYSDPCCSKCTFLTYMRK